LAPPLGATLDGASAGVRGWTPRRLPVSNE
jgi:hypothetical protein